MQKNEIYHLRAEKLGADMEGICRLNGMPVFVPGMLPGEETDVRIVKAEKRYAFGRMETPPVISSPDRRDPGCPAWPRCGGCTCRHMLYEATLEESVNRFETVLKESVAFPLMFLRCLEWNALIPTETKPPCPAAAQPKHRCLVFMLPVPMM